LNIYVGNLSPDLTEEDLKQEFSAFGEVKSVKIIKDKYNGQSRGFGFIEMPTRTDGETAINNLKRKTLKDRTIEVNEAQSQTGRGSKSDQIGGSYGGRGSSFGGEGKNKR
jgi:RNA recognition motif-containing protein